MYPKIKNPEKPTKYKKPKIEVVNEVNPLPSIIKNYYSGLSTEALELSVDMLPPSANKLYEKSVRFSVKSNKNVIHHSNHNDVEVFRAFITTLCRKRNLKFLPIGTVAVVVELYSDSWLNKDRTVKKIDSDNMLKPLMDALQVALGFPDEMVFYHHLFKCVHPKQKGVRVTLFDTSPIVYQ